MKIPRVVIGRRSASDLNPGLYVSPPGINAQTADPSQLTLNISTKVNQLLVQGYVTGNATVPLGVTGRPIVFLTSRYKMSDDYGYGHLDGPIRPSPYTNTFARSTGSGMVYTPAPPSSFATINSGGVSMTITTTVRTDYSVYRSAFA